MDMTLGTSLDEMGRARLARLATAAHPVVAGLASAALRIDTGEFAQAQTILLSTINDFASLGADVPMDAYDAVQATLGSIQGIRHQTCTLRSCLEAIKALHVNPRATSMGERIGRMHHALAELMAHRAALPMAA